MNRSETARLLAAVAAFNNRTIGEADVEAWQSVLPDVDLVDAMEAVRRHYAEHTEWLMPAHVRRIVRDIHGEREALARHTGWAPGQAGVPRDEALPEVTRVDRLALEALTTEVADIVRQVRTMLPEGSREALFPRRTAWEREQKAFLRVRDSQPNPHYKPRAEALRCDGCGELLSPHGFHARSGRTRCDPTTAEACTNPDHEHFPGDPVMDSCTA